MKNLIYKNSPKSGIGDRLICIIFVYTYSKYVNCKNIYLHWNEDTNNMIGNEDIYSVIRKNKTPFRGVDYLLKNFNRFITLPEDIHFVDKETLKKMENDKENIIFNEIFCIGKSIDYYIKKLKIGNDFKKKYNDNFKKIKFKCIPENIVNFFKNNEIVTVHLRRGDKVANDENSSKQVNGVALNQLQSLNNKTLDSVVYFYNLNKKNIYFVSDENDTREKFINIFKKYNNCKTFFKGDNISQTYIDLYSLSHSKIIIMSQKFSSFSLVASLMKDTKMYHLLESSIISNNYNYTNINTFNKNFINKETNAYIFIHQGFADLFNLNGMINYYSEIYKTIYIFSLNESRHKVMSAIFENNKNVFSIIIKDFNEKIKNPCICYRCHGHSKDYTKCYMDRTKKCKILDYDKINGKIINSGVFGNYEKWKNFKNKQFSFAHSFYLYNDLNPEIRFTHFKLFNNKTEENEVYNNFVKKYTEHYILVHEDNFRNFFIDKLKIKNKNLNIVNLNCISEKMVDYTKVIKNAKEIHLIDSSWSVFVYMLSYKEIETPVFLNELLFKKMGRDTNIYKNPTFKNWTFY